MLSPRLTNCVECTTIPVLINEIDCKIAQLAGNLYNNVVFMLNQPVPANVMIDLLNYRRILTFKYCNPDYAGCFTVPMIASKVKILTVNNKPMVRPSCGTTTTTSSSSSTTTSTSSTTTTTSTSSSTTTTTTTDPYYYYVANQYLCPDCEHVTGTNVIIKGSTPVPIGNWVMRNPGSGWSAYQVLSQTDPFYMATLVDTYISTSTCSCPATTTTTTTIAGPTINIGLDVSSGCTVLTPISGIFDGGTFCTSSTITSLDLPFSDYIGSPDTYVSFFVSDGSGQYRDVLNPAIGEYTATIIGSCLTCPS